jgi:uncharacterized membrane protein
MKTTKTKKKAAPVEGNESKICAILAYILIGIIWYFVDDKMKKNAAVKFHVKQGIVLFIFSIAWSIVMQILLVITLFLLWPVVAILSYVPLIFMILGIINAINDKEKEMPIIGKYAGKLTF